MTIYELHKKLNKEHARVLAEAERDKGEYLVNLWGSKPGTNDDWWNSKDFETKEEALACFEKPEDYFKKLEPSDVFIEIDGPDIHQERRIAPDYKEKDDCSDWQREMAMQNGMAFGVQGYNDTYGY